VEIAGKTALVTGAARGIGRAIAHGLAAERAGVLVVDLDAEAGQHVLDELRAGGAEARFLAADVTNEVDVAAMVAHVERELGGLDILVNNAGGYSEPVFPDAPVAHWSRTLDLNLRTVMLAVHYASRAMARGGAIVNIASTAGLGLAPHPGPEYAVAKAGVMRLTACLAPLAAQGIRVNCVCPHTVGTEAVRQTIAELTARGEELPAALRDEPLEPEDIADAVIELVRADELAGRVMLCRGGEPRRLLPNDDDP
jgi:NAD(P)-dependent dehydrogenase (short-subunit alcohol dehydrogenase family)